MGNIINEFKEARDRTREYIDYARKHPKSERDDISEAILRSYREVLCKWFFGLLGLILINGILGLIAKSIINSLF